MRTATVARIQKVCLLTPILLLLLGCKQVRKVTDILVKPSSRDIYAREFQNEDTLELGLWQDEFEKAKTDSLTIYLPYVEVGTYFENRNVVYSYQVNLEKGSILHVNAVTAVFGSRIFSDVLKINQDSTFEQVSSSASGKNALKVGILEPGLYRILIQPEIDARGNFAHQIYTRPSFGFPVVGKDNKAIKSYWGAARDRGTRRHEGIDIFAERGTPVIAVAEGYIRATGNKGLGGKQVWLQTGAFGKSLYYAHLDSIMAKTGAKVILGDTLGLVGNSGNARTTRPHLHFGIYEVGQGAIDPLPYIKRTVIPQHGMLNTIFPLKEVTASVVNLRNTPSVKSRVIGEVSQNDTLELLGYSDNWAHIRSKKGKKAFVHRSLLSSPLN